MTMSEFKVIIIGGGLSGALLANGLLRHGVSTTVYERDPEDHQREGYQIRLGEPSLIGFRACLDETRISQIEAKFGLSEGNVQDPARKTVGPHVYTSRFEPVVDLNAFPNYSTSSAIDRVVLRSFLADPVKEQGCLRYGKAFDRYEIIPSEKADKVRVCFKDGSFEICDVLIGADGSGSQVMSPALALPLYHSPYLTSNVR